jgi:nucleoside phosphorylase
MALVDFGLLAALPEEFKDVRLVFPELREQGEDSNVWYRGRLASPQRSGVAYSLVAVQQRDMGPLNAQTHASKTIDQWDPAYLVLVGIAGSMHNDVKLGDVVVSQQVFYFDPGKIKDERLEYRPEGYPCSLALIKQTQAFEIDAAVYEAWREDVHQLAVKLKGEYSKTLTSADRETLDHFRPNIHYGTLASGSLVVASEDKKKELLQLHGKILATEMEGAGLLHATFQQETPTPAVVMKGISDAADANKDSKDAMKIWRILASQGSAMLARRVMERGRFRPLHTDEFDVDPGLDEPSAARNILGTPVSGAPQFIAFPRLVVPLGPLTELAISVRFVLKDGREIAPSQGRVDYVTCDGQERQTDLKRGQQVLSITGRDAKDRIAAKPIRAYYRLDEQATGAQFTVATPADSRTFQAALTRFVGA